MISRQIALALRAYAPDRRVRHTLWTMVPITGSLVLWNQHAARHEVNSAEFAARLMRARELVVSD